VPIQTGPDADEVRGFAETLGQHLSQAYRNEMTMESRIAARQGRVYLDPFRNGFAQTVVSPYCVRRAAKAPVSTPLAWSEVRPTLDPSEFNLGNFDRRLAKKDPWEGFFENRQPLAHALRAVRSL
jgi:bifunctional non-homologous end joining protein LigD